jgi:HAE1 family hydrophobic/amphiphilic exporter-1
MFEPVEERELVLRYNLHTSYTLERVKETVDTIEDYLYSNKDDFEIASVYTYYETRMAESTLLLVDDEGAEKSVEQIKQMIEEGLPKIAIGEPTFGYRDRNGGEVVRVFVQGESMQVLEELASEVARRVSGVDGFADVQSEAEAGRDEIQVAIDNDRARYYGLSKQEVAGVISSGIRGRNLRKIRGSEAEVDVFLTLQKEERENPADMQQLVVSKTGTAPVRLSELTELTMGKSPGQIVRQNRKTSLGISMNLEDGKTVEEAREQITSIMDGMQLPTGYQWSFGRSFGMNEDAGSAMLFNIIIAFVLIYLVMAGLFESLMYPASILACILFGVVGIFWFFLVTGTTFDLMATIGILILMGIVVNNGIVLIDHILHLRSTGMDRTEAIIQGGQDRMRAILMTAGTTILGLIPLSMGTTLIGGDGPPYFPMARAIVGGLSFSTVITLVVLPSIYMMLDDVRLWSARLVEES